MSKAVVCPNCRNKLTIVGKDVKCSSCGQKGKIGDGVIDFLKDSYYWGEIPPEDMRNLLIESKRKGWKEAVYHLVDKYPKMEEYLLDHGRIDWFFHAFAPGKTVNCLDIGSGWGSLSFDLANYFNNVYSLESVKERVAFQSIRKSQDRVNNLNIVRADFQKLPFPDNFFDLVVVNGVLEWVGISNYSDNPRNLQVKFLKEIKRVLKPGGCVYVGIENRFGLHYLLGAEDHSGLPFTSLLPRYLATVVTRYLRKTGGKYSLRIRMEEEWSDYRTYIYTLAGYQKLLGDSGFDIVEKYWTLFYSNPKFSGPIEGKNFKLFLKYISERSQGANGSMGKKLADFGKYLPDFIACQFLRFFSPSFLIFAYKDKKTSTLQDKIVGSNMFLKMGGSGSEKSKINYFVSGKEGFSNVVKFARYNKFSKYLENEESLAEKFGEMPEVKKIKVNGFKLLKEKVVDMGVLDTSDESELMKSIEWLISFEEKTRSKEYLYKQLIREKGKIAGTLRNITLKDLEKDKLKKTTDEFLVLVRKSGLRAASVHGDYCAMNIFRDSKGGLKVLDWEDYEEKGNIFKDIVFFVMHLLVKEGGIENLKANLEGNSDYSKSVKKAVSKFLEYYDLPREIFYYAIPFVALSYLNKVYQNDGGHMGHKDYHLNILKVWLNLDRKLV